MRKYTKISEGHGFVSIGNGSDGEAYEKMGYTLQDVEQGHDGAWYLAGYAPKPTEAELFDSLRTETARRLMETDMYGMDDYPDNEKRAEFRAYRAELRALNRQPGAPWDGGGELTPWPIKPV